MKRWHNPMLQSQLEEAAYLTCLKKIPLIVWLTEKSINQVKKPPEYMDLWSKISRLYKRSK